jgi:ketosteroid isomerase-like protein
MSEQPDVIQRYLDAAAQEDFDGLTACFTDDATVTDEDRTYHGRNEIRAWREKTAAAFEYTAEVLRSEPTGPDGYRVTAKIEGTFPGSPVELVYRFTLRGPLISELVIAP